MKTVQMYLPEKHPNRPTTKLEKLQGLVFHYTGNDAPSATASMNALYFARRYSIGSDGKFYEVDGKTPFAYGSAQVIADMLGVIETMPLDEVAYGCGDRRLPWDDVYRGQQKAAHNFFGNRQNLQTINIEICNNDAIPSSQDDWRGACNNAFCWAVDFLKEKDLHIDFDASLDPQTIPNVQPGKIVILRHYDVSGKICPKPFVDNNKAWTDFVTAMFKLVG